MDKFLVSVRWCVLCLGFGLAGAYVYEYAVTDYEIASNAPLIQVSEIAQACSHCHNGVNAIACDPEVIRGVADGADICKAVDGKNNLCRETGFAVAGHLARYPDICVPAN